MAKYTIIKDITLTTIRPVGSNIAQRPVSFKIGDIVDGELGGNPANDTGYLQVTTPQGTVQFSTSRGSVIRPYSGTANTSTPPKTEGNGNQQKLQTETKSFFTPKNIIIGVLAIGAVLGLLKWQKVI